MRILVLGATSQVGAALAEAFARGNDLILTGRNGSRLCAAANKCKSAGAAQVTNVEQDFRAGIRGLLGAIEGKRIDLVIDAASASSSHRDAEIESSEMPGCVAADFLSRTAIMDQILGSQDTPPAMIFISTVLVFVRSPGRAIYTSLKTLYETYLAKIRMTRPEFALLIVYVGTVIDTRHATGKPKKLASAVFKAFTEKRERLFFGLSGLALLALYYFQPILYYGITVAQRRIRSLLA